MRAKRIIVTSSGTLDSEDISPAWFHRAAVQAGYSRSNHHYVIIRSGSLVSMRDKDKPGMSLTGEFKKYNMDSLSVMLVGSKDYSAEQLDTLYGLLEGAMRDGLDIVSHSDLYRESGLEASGKPGFNLHTFLEERNNKEHG